MLPGRDAVVDALERLLQRPFGRRQLVGGEETPDVVTGRSRAERRQAGDQVDVGSGDVDLRQQLRPVALDEGPGATARGSPKKAPRYSAVS
jgi:hypothetical protein